MSFCEPLSPCTARRQALGEEPWCLARSYDVKSMNMKDAPVTTTAGCTSKTPVKAITKFRVEEQAACPAWAPSSATASLSSATRKMIVIEVHARSFLYHQMRLMVAWLVEVGAGRRAAAETAGAIPLAHPSQPECGTWTMK